MTNQDRQNFVPTIVTKRIVEGLDYARDFNSIITVSGPTGRSKTHTALAWVQDNASRAHYFRVPSNCTTRTLLILLCRAFGIGTNCASSVMHQKLFDAITADTVLIFDEAGFLLPKGSRTSCPLELIRDLHDSTSCAVALIFTDVYLPEMKAGARADFYEQFFGRIGFNVPIPERVFMGEVRPICQYFVPDAADNFIKFAHKTASERDGKLRTLFEDLRRASDFAAAASRKCTLADLKTAVAWRKSGGIWPEE